MKSLQARVRTLLDETGLPVTYGWPALWNRFPCAAWYESGSRALAQADGREYLTELNYTVDIWADAPAELAEAAQEIDARLSGAGLRRVSSLDLYEDGPRLFRRSMRYRAVVDVDGGVWQ